MSSYLRFAIILFLGFQIHLVAQESLSEKSPEETGTVVELPGGGSPTTDEKTTKDERDPIASDNNPNDVVGIDMASLSAHGFDLSAFMPSFPLSKDLVVKPTLSYSEDEYLSRRGDYFFAPPKTWKSHLGELIQIVPANNDIPFTPEGAPNRTMKEGAAMQEIQTIFINPQGQTMSFYPDPKDPAFSKDLLDDMSQPVRTFFGENGTYQLKHNILPTYPFDVDPLKDFEFELKNGAGLTYFFSFMDERMGEVGASGDQVPGLSRHFVVTKVEDRYGNYLLAQYRPNTNQITSLEGYKNGSATAQYVITYDYEAYDPTNSRYRLSQITYPKINGGVQSITLNYFNGINQSSDPEKGAYASCTITSNLARFDPINTTPIDCILYDRDGTGKNYFLKVDMAAIQDTIPSFLQAHNPASGNTVSYIFKINGKLFAIGKEVSGVRQSNFFQAEPYSANRRMQRKENAQSVKLPYEYDTPNQLAQIELTNISGTPATTGETSMFIYPMIKKGDVFMKGGNTATAAVVSEDFPFNFTSSGSAISGVLGGSGSGVYSLYRHESQARIQEVALPTDQPGKPRRIVFTYSDPSLNHQELAKVEYFDETIPNGAAYPYYSVDYIYERIRTFAASASQHVLGSNTSFCSMWKIIRDDNNTYIGSDDVCHFEPNAGVRTSPTPYGKRVPLIFEHDKDIVRQKVVRYRELDNSGQLGNEEHSLTTFFGGRFFWVFGQIASVVAEEPRHCSIHHWGVDSKPFEFTWKILPDGTATVFDLTTNGIGLPPGIVAEGNQRSRVYKTYQFEGPLDYTTANPSDGFKGVLESFDTRYDFTGSLSNPQSFSKYFEFAPKHPYSINRPPYEAKVYYDKTLGQIEIIGEPGSNQTYAVFYGDGTNWNRVGTTDFGPLDDAGYGSFEVTLPALGPVYFEAVVSSSPQPEPADSELHRVFVGSPECQTRYSQGGQPNSEGVTLSHLFAEGNCFNVSVNGYELVPLWRTNLSQYLNVNAIETAYGYCDFFFDGAENPVNTCIAGDAGNPQSRFDALLPHLEQPLGFGRKYLLGIINRPVDVNGTLLDSTIRPPYDYYSNPVDYEEINGEVKKVPWSLRKVTDPRPFDHRIGDGYRIRTISNTNRIGRLMPSFSYSASRTLGETFSWNEQDNLPTLLTNDVDHISRHSNGGFLFESTGAYSLSGNDESFSFSGVLNLKQGDVFYYMGFPYTVTAVVSGTNTDVSFWPALRMTPPLNDPNNQSSGFAPVNLTFFRFFNPKNFITVQYDAHLSSNQIFVNGGPSLNGYMGYDAFGNQGYSETYKKGIGFRNEGSGFSLVPNFFGTSSSPDATSWNDSTSIGNNRYSDWSFFGRVSRSFSGTMGPLYEYTTRGQTTPPTGTFVRDSVGVGAFVKTDYNELTFPYLPSQSRTYFRTSVNLDANGEIDLSSGANVPTANDEDVITVYHYFSDSNSGNLITGNSSLNFGRLAQQKTSQVSETRGVEYKRFNYHPNTGQLSDAYSAVKMGSFLDSSGSHTRYQYALNSDLVSKEIVNSFTPTLDNGLLTIPVEANLNFHSAKHSFYDDLGRIKMAYTEGRNHHVFGVINRKAYPSGLVTESFDYFTKVQLTPGSELTLSNDQPQTAAFQTIRNGLGQVRYSFSQNGVDSKVYGSEMTYDDFSRPLKTYPERTDGSTDLPALNEIANFFSFPSSEPKRAFTKVLYDRRGQKFGDETYHDLHSNGTLLIASESYSFTQKDSEGHVEYLLSSKDSSKFLIKAQHVNRFGFVDEIKDYEAARGIFNTTTGDWVNSVTLGAQLSSANYEFDRQGNVIQALVTDPGDSSKTQTRLFIFDQRGRLRHEAHPEMGFSGNLTRGVVRYFNYNFWNRPGNIQELSSTGSVRQRYFYYDAFGNLLTQRVTEPGKAEWKVENKFEYSQNPDTPSPNLLRFTRSSVMSGSTWAEPVGYVYNYDQHDRLVSREMFHKLYYTNNSIAGYCYALRNATVNFNGLTSSIPLELKYEYDAYTARVLKTIYPAPVASNLMPTTLVNNFDDAYGHRVSFRDASLQSDVDATLVSDIELGPGNRIVSYKYPNNQLIENRLDTLQRLKEMVFNLPALGQAKRTYEFDRLGRIVLVNIDNPGASSLDETYQYDAIGQLVNATVSKPAGGTISYQYSYDGFGNLVLKDNNDPTVPGVGMWYGSSNTSNRLVSINANENVEYTNFGELWKIHYTEGTHQWNQNSDGRVATFSVTGGSTYKYTYDPFGMRIAKKTDNILTDLYFYNESNQVLTEFVHNTDLNQLIWDKTYIYFDGDVALTYEDEAHFSGSSRSVNPVTNGLINEPILNWESSEADGRYKLEVKDESGTIVKSLSFLDDKEINLYSQLLYGSYQYRVSFMNGEWSPWQAFDYGPPDVNNYVLQYLCEGNGLDQTEFENHATLQGPVLTTGHDGQGLFFDGNDQMVLAAPAGFPSSGQPFRKILWIKPQLQNSEKGLEAGITYNRIFQYQSGGGWGELSFIAFGYTSTGHFYFQTPSGTNSVTGTTLQWDQWQKVSLEIKNGPIGSGFLRLYFQDQLIYTANFSVNTDPQGTWTWGSTRTGMIGSLDDVTLELMEGE